MSIIKFYDGSHIFGLGSPFIVTAAELQEDGRTILGDACVFVVQWNIGQVRHWLGRINFRPGSEANANLIAEFTEEYWSDHLLEHSRNAIQCMQNQHYSRRRDPIIVRLVKYQETDKRILYRLWFSGIGTRYINRTRQNVQVPMLRQMLEGIEALPHAETKE